MITDRTVGNKSEREQVAWLAVSLAATPWTVARKLASKTGLGPMDHHRAKRGHGEREEMTANSLRPRAEAEADQRRRAARDGGRRAPARVWRRRVSKRERGKEGKQARRLHKANMKLGDQLTWARKPRMTATVVVGRALFPTRSKRGLLLRAWDEMVAWSRVRKRRRRRAGIYEQG